MADEAQAGVAEPVEETVLKKTARQQKKPKRQPPYNVILWDDQEHTPEYVITMMQQLFGHPPEKGYQIAQEVDGRGRAIVLTTTREHAELKARPDPRVWQGRCDCKLQRLDVGNHRTIA